MRRALWWPVNHAQMRKLRTEESRHPGALQRV